MVGSEMVLTTNICSGFEFGTPVIVKAVLYGERVVISSTRKNVGTRSVNTRHLMTPEDYKNGGWLAALGNNVAVPKDFNPDNYTIDSIVNIRNEMATSKEPHPDALTPREMYMLHFIEQLAVNTN